MNGFMRGMNSIGNLFPLVEKKSKIDTYSAWLDVGNAFKAVGASVEYLVSGADHAAQSDVSEAIRHIEIALDDLKKR